MKSKPGTSQFPLFFHSRKELIQFVIINVGLVLASFLVSPLVCMAQEPTLLEFRKSFHVGGLNDKGQLVGTPNLFGTSEPPGIWDSKTGNYQQLGVLNGAIGAFASGINNNGQVSGTTTFPSDRPGDFFTRATRWSGASPADLGAVNAPDGKGLSSGNAINNSGLVVGNSTYCFDEKGNDCRGPYPAAGSPMRIAGPTPDQTTPSGRGMEAVNDAGVGVGARAIFPGGAEISVNFNPRAILSDGTVIGSRFGSGGVVRRTPDGTVTNIPCGSDVYDANDAGDILSYVVDVDGLRLWHDGQCFRVSELLPDGISGWRFPSHSPSSGGAELNELGHIGTNASKPGVPVKTASDYFAVVLIPKFPFAVEVSVSPTNRPDEFVFETTVIRGKPAATTTWNFGDGETPVVSGTKITKRFTKPGTYTVSAKVTDINGATATSTRTVTVVAPKLVVGLIATENTTDGIPSGKTIKIDVNVAALNDGVGELTDLTFQGGIFTVADGEGVLEFTTAAIPPFSLAPGTANAQSISVKAANQGDVTLRTLVIGKDSAGRTVSATADLQLRVVPSDPDLTGELSANVTETSQKGVVSVALTNTTKTTLTGRIYFIKPLKTAARGMAFLRLASDLDIRMSNRASTKAPKITTYSKKVTFSVAGQSAANLKIGLLKTYKPNIAAGKALKASLVLDIDGIAGASATSRNIGVTLKFKRKKK